MTSNYIATIINHSDASTIYMVRVLAARNEDEAKVKAFAWYFECPEDNIKLDLGSVADHTIKVTIEEDIPVIC